MFYSLSGELKVKNPNFAVIETRGIGFKIFVSGETAKKLPKVGDRATIFCLTCISRENIALYGFLSEKERGFFESLISINGIGPRAALKILGVANLENLLSAVRAGRSDFLVRAAGIGRKKAERIILELRDKIRKTAPADEHGLNFLEMNREAGEALRTLGYRRNEIEEAIQKIPLKAKTLEEKIKSALKFLSRR